MLAQNMLWGHLCGYTAQQTRIINLAHSLPELEEKKGHFKPPEPYCRQEAFGFYLPPVARRGYFETNSDITKSL